MGRRGGLRRICCQGRLALQSSLMPRWLAPLSLPCSPTPRASPTSRSRGRVAAAPSAAVCCRHWRHRHRRPGISAGHQGSGIGRSEDRIWYRSRHRSCCLCSFGGQRTHEPAQVTAGVSQQQHRPRRRRWQQSPRGRRYPRTAEPSEVDAGRPVSGRWSRQGRGPWRSSASSRSQGLYGQPTERGGSFGDGGCGPPLSREPTAQSAQQDAGTKGDGRRNTTSRCCPSCGWAP